MTVTLNTSSFNSTAFKPYVPTVGQASTAAALSSQAASLSAQSAVVASLGGSTSSATVYSPSGLLNSSGVYSSSGSSAALSEQAASNWAELLKTRPNLASNLVASSYSMGVVSSLQVTA